MKDINNKIITRNFLLTYSAVCEMMGHIVQFVNHIEVIMLSYSSNDIPSKYFKSDFLRNFSLCACFD